MKRIENGVALNGFTLIEMMIVIAVIAILVGVLLPQFRGTQDEAAEQRAKAELRTIATAIESYYIHHSNTLPATLSALTSVTPRIITVIPDDPFNGTNDYQYAKDANSVYYVVFSIGSDRAADVSGINTSGQITEAVGGDCTEDVLVTNGVRTDASGNAC
ncbi:MAG: type II secretion system protein GspG [Candidatus Omnitrophica bacterium]|nr:type II secretion system protein GspG [Candidatus Omnitrophota bacterium]